MSVPSQESGQSCICVLGVFIFCFLLDYILELLWQCGIFCFSLYISFIISKGVLVYNHDRTNCKYRLIKCLDLFHVVAIISTSLYVTNRSLTHSLFVSRIRWFFLHCFYELFPIFFNLFSSRICMKYLLIEVEQPTINLLYMYLWGNRWSLFPSKSISFFISRLLSYFISILKTFCLTPAK